MDAIKKACFSACTLKFPFLDKNNQNNLKVEKHL